MYTLFCAAEIPIKYVLLLGNIIVNIIICKFIG